MIIKTRQAVQIDSSEIIRILRQHLISFKQGDSQLESQGFLIYPHTLTDIKSFILDKENYFVLVAEDNNRVIGFAICCDIKLMISLKLHLASLPNMTELTSSRILYLKQIAKENGTTGAGKVLMQSILQYASEVNCNYVISQIAHFPVRNSRSISFHEKSGFKLISTVEENDNTTGIYLKKLN
jgi:hypothetical protein